MTTRRRLRAPRSENDDAILERADASLLEIVDHVLNKGVLITGDLMLGVAEVDLVYIRISAMLCAADHVLYPRKKP
jgi:hypothetical protein